MKLVRRWRRRRYMRRCAAVERALRAVEATTSTNLTTGGLAALVVDIACYGGKRFREIVGLDWDSFVSERSEDWWHENDLPKPMPVQASRPHNTRESDG